MATYTVEVPATEHGELRLTSTGDDNSLSGRENKMAGTYAIDTASTVTVTAVADTGYGIASWADVSAFSSTRDVVSSDPSGGTASFDVSAAKVVSAPAFAKYHQVRVTVDGAGCTVSQSVADSNSDSSGSSFTVWVRDGQTLSLSNSPASGYTFVGDDAPGSITAPCVVTARFEPASSDADDANAATDADTGSGDYIGHDTGRKHLLLKVPAYELSGPFSSVTSSATWDAAESPKNALIQIGDATRVTTGSAATEGNDLLAGHVNFLDDTRFRGDTGDPGGTFSGELATPPNETEERSADVYSDPFASHLDGDTTDKNAKVTHTIPLYTGWRDHTDGHRITTTRGDKVEVIGGNYKIVSLGRGTGVASYEMSGGIITDAMEAPGNQTSVTWRDCPTGADGEKGWKVVEQTVKGNTVSRYHGTQREEFYGDELISVVGAPKSGGSYRTSGFTLDDGKDGEHEFVSGQGSFGTNVGGNAFPTKWDQRGGVAPALTQPDIRESTWAKSVTSYTNVEGEHREENHYQGGHTAHTYIQAGCRHTEHFWGDHLEYFMGAKTEFFLGATTTIGLANRMELFVGLEQQVNLGALMEMRIGPSVSVGFFDTEFVFDRKAAHLFRKAVQIDDVKAALNQTEGLLQTTRGDLRRANIGLEGSMMFLSNKL